MRLHRDAMERLLTYWHTGPRLDPVTGLHVWYDQMESGADDLVYSPVASAHTPGWTVEEHGYSLASPDLQTFLWMEHTAMALFCEAWGGGASSELTAAAAQHRASAAAIKQSLNTHLWRWEDEAAGKGNYVAYNVKTRTLLLNRTYQMALPLLVGLAPSPRHAAAAVAAVLAPDMRCPYGVRSTSSLDARYGNANIIVP